jgi:hypothetical protein
VENEKLKKEREMRKRKLGKKGEKYKEEDSGKRN